MIVKSQGMNLKVIHSVLLSATMGHRSILLILSTFEGVLVPRKQSSIFRIKAKFSVAFTHAPISLLGSFLLLARHSAVYEKKRLHYLLIPQKQKWCERSMLHLKDSLVILPFLFVFIFLMNSWKTVV